MNRIALLATVALFASTAHAAPGAVYVDDATDSIALSVANVSGSSDVNDRAWALLSDAPLVHAEGDFGCPVGTTGDTLELSFGTMWMSGSTPTSFVLWDQSDPLDLNGQPFGSYDIDHALDLPEGWIPGEALIDLGFNPSAFIEFQYQMSKSKGADMVHWMQSDQLFSTSFSMNVVVWCDGGNEVVGGLTTIQVDVDILVDGDRGIGYQPTTGTATDITPGTDDKPDYDAGTGGTGGTSGTGTAPATSTATDTAASTTAPASLR